MKSEQRQKQAFKYYLMGLNSKEIAKLLDISFKTVQYYMLKGNWKQKRKTTNLKSEILKQYEQGKTYLEIAKIFNISRSSVYNHLRNARKFKSKKS